MLHSMCVLSCVRLSDPVDRRPPGSSVHGTLKARILEGLPFPSPGCYTVGTCVFYIQYIIVSANPKLMIYPFRTYHYPFLMVSLSVSLFYFINDFICVIFKIPHISDILEYLYFFVWLNFT